ncbi:hypothetical protein KCU94_g19134, partial [Aureobasidium melanogenum]
MVAEKEHQGQEGRSWPASKPNRNSQTDSEESLKKRPVKWSLGILNDKETDEVPVFRLCPTPLESIQSQRTARTS